MNVAKSTKKLSTTNLIVAAVVVCVLALLALIFAGRILSKKIILEGKIISKKNQANETLDKNLAALPQLSSNYQNLGATKDLIESALPTTADFPSVVITAEAIAAASNVVLDNVSTATSSTIASSAGTTDSAASASAGPQAQPQSFSFSVAIKGKYADILTFAKNLQLSARPIKITGMQLTGTTDQLSGTIQMNTYYFQPQVLQDQTEVVK